MLWPKWLQQGSNAMSKLVTDIVVETLQRAGVKHCYGVVGDILNLPGGSRRELRPREPAPYQRDIRGQSRNRAKAAFRSMLFGSPAKAERIIFCLHRHGRRMPARKMNGKACEFERDRFAFF